MEPKNTQQESQTLNRATYTCRLHQVTPLSKYLAMALFITMPFIGGWIGYMCAPEKVVEVERFLVKEIEVSLGCEFNGVCSLNPEYVSDADGFLQVEDVLDVAPFQWVRNDAYREYEYMRMVSPTDYFSKETEDIHCFFGSNCLAVTVVGDRYSQRFLETDIDAGLLEDFAMRDLGKPLMEQGYVNIAESAKGRQFGEVYQKTIGDTSQLVTIYSKPINLTFSADGSYPTSEGIELRVFVSSPFVITNR